MIVACIRCGEKLHLVDPDSQLVRGRKRKGRWYSNSWLDVPNSTWYACYNCFSEAADQCWDLARQLCKCPCHQKPGLARKRDASG